MFTHCVVQAIDYLRGVSAPAGIDVERRTDLY
jgi:hypothetical protein